MTSYELTLLLVSDATDWNKYVTSRLARSPQVRHQTVVMDSLLYENPPEVTLACQQSAVVMLIVTPELVDFMEQKAGWFSRALQEVPATSAIVLFVLLEEKDSNRLRDIAESSYASADWTYFDPGYEERDVHKTIAKVLDIVEQCQVAKSKALKNEEEATDTRSDEVPEKEEKTTDSQCETGNKEEELTGGGEQAEAAAAAVKKKTPPPPPHKNPQSVVQLFPSVLHESGVQVAIVFKEEVKGNITLKVEHTDIHLTLERENEKVFTFVAPELAPGKHKVLILEGGKRRARASLTVHGTEMDMFQTPHYLCQVLGVANLQQLDLQLKEVFSTSLPSAGSGLETIFHHLSDLTEQQKHSETLYPTLLHYAAAHGLSEFCAALLECPGSSQAYHIHNCDGRDPADLAASGGFEELENYIIDFMEMQTAKEIYDRYVTMLPTAAEAAPGYDSDEYEDMTQVSTPPSRRRATSEPAVSVSPPPSLPPPRQQPLTSQAGAGHQNRPPLPPPRQKDGGVSSTRSMSERRASPPCALQAISEVEQQKSSTMPPTAGMSPAEFMGMGRTDPFQMELPAAALGSRGQSELLELHDMVKSKEINLNEACMLFNSWQNRYGKTPTSSFKDRRKELTDIKTEYQKVRETMNKEDKSKSFFARLGLGGRQAKSTIKVNISDPVVQRQQKGPRVYTKSASTSQLFSDRASNASTVSSSSSSRDSGWSQGSRDSHVSSACEGDSERDEVFEHHGSMRRSRSTRDSTKRVSLGHQYLQQTEEEMDKQDAPPPPVPPRTNRPSLSGSSSCTRSGSYRH